MKKSKLPVEQIQKVIDEVQVNYDYTICSWPADKEGAASPCKKPAGWGTDHLGEGYCSLHGGKGHPKTAGGLYSKYLASSKDPTILERYREFLNDEDIKKIDGEIALLRMKLVGYLSLDSTMPLEPGVVPAVDPSAQIKLDAGIIRIIDKITQIVERKHKIEEGEKYTITVEGIQNVLLQIIAVIKQEVVDSEQVKRILTRIKEEVKV